MLFLMFSLSSVESLYEMLIDERHWPSLRRFLERWRSRGVLVGDRKAVREVFERARDERKAREIAEPGCQIKTGNLIRCLSDGTLPIIRNEEAARYGVDLVNILQVNPLRWFESLKFCEPLSGSVPGDIKVIYRELAIGLCVSESIIVVDPYFLSGRQGSFIDFLVKSVQRSRIHSISAYCMLDCDKNKKEWYDPVEVCEWLGGAISHDGERVSVNINYCPWSRKDPYPDHVMHDRYIFMGSSKDVEHTPRIVSVGHPRALEGEGVGNEFIQSTSFSIVDFSNFQEVLGVWKQRSEKISTSS